MTVNDIVRVTGAIHFTLAKVTKLTDDAVFAQLVPGGYSYEYTNDDVAPYASPTAESDWLYNNRYSGRTDWWLFEELDAQRERATGRRDWWMLPRQEVEAQVKAQEERDVAARQHSSSALPFEHTCLECGTHFNGTLCPQCGSDEFLAYAPKKMNM